MSTDRKLLGLLFGSQAVLSASYGAMFTVLKDFRDEYHINESGLGLIVATGFILSFVAQLTLAPLADRGHARTMMTFGVAIAALGTAGMAVGQSLAFLMGSRAIMGVGTGMAIPAIRRVIILARPNEVGSNLGRMLSIDVCGFMAGPIISAITVDRFGLSAPFWLIAGLTAAAVPWLARVTVAETDPENMPSQRFALDLLRIREVAGAIVIGLAVFLMIGAFDSLWSVVIDDLGGARWMSSVGITVFAIPLIVLGPIGGRLVERHGPFRMSSIGLVVGAGCMVAYGSLPLPMLMLAVGVVHALNDGLTITGTGVAVALVAPPERTASAQGLLGGLQTLTGGLAAISAGWSYQHFGRFPTYAAVAGAMVALVVIGSLLVGRSWHSRPADQPSDHSGDHSTAAGLVAPTAA